MAPLEAAVSAARTNLIIVDYAISGVSGQEKSSYFVLVLGRLALWGGQG